MKFKPVKNFESKVGIDIEIGGKAVAGLLGSNEPKKPAGEIDDILPADVKLNYYERKEAKEFLMLMRTMWAYSFFIVRVRFYFKESSLLTYA